MTAAARVVGPNAILQMEAALDAQGGRALTERVFARAGLGALLADPPAAMVPQESAAALFRAVHDTLPEDVARQVAVEAGRRTGAYILRHRIPTAARLCLQALPSRLAAPLLMRAITAHAWTFAGSGRVVTDAGPPARIEIHDNPLAVARCDWHAAVLETLFARLVHPRATVAETECGRDASGICVFFIALGG